MLTLGGSWVASSPVLRGCRVLPSTPAGDRQGGRCMRRSRVSGLYPRPALLAHPPPSDLPSPEILGSGNFFFLQEKKKPNSLLTIKVGLAQEPPPPSHAFGQQERAWGIPECSFPNKQQHPMALPQNERGPLCPSPGTGSRFSHPT